MDRLELFVVEYDNPWFMKNGKQGEVIEFYLNGRNLLDILEECFKQENRKFNQNKYVGISPDDAFLPSRHLLGQSEWTTNDQTILYTCSECGIPSCASVHVQIVIADDSVIWKNFTNIAAVADGDFEDRFICKIPIFTFDRADYEAALRYHIARKIHGLLMPAKRW